MSTNRIDIGELGHSLGYLLRIAQVRAYDQFFDVLGEYGLRPGEFSVLWTIHQNPGARHGVLAETLCIKLAHMTKTVRRLEERGLVVRSIPDEDRRAVVLSLSAEGEAFISEHGQLFFGSATYLRHDLSASEEKELVRLLRRFSGLSG